MTIVVLVVYRKRVHNKNSVDNIIKRFYND